MAEKTKIHKGYCPEQEDEYAISVKYYLIAKNQEWLKAEFACKYNLLGGKCSRDCPLFNEAPEII